MDHDSSKKTICPIDLIATLIYAHYLRRRSLRRSDSMELNNPIRTNDFLLHDVSTFWNPLIAGALSSPFIPSQGFIANQQLQNVFMELFLSHHKDFELFLCVRCLVMWQIIVSYSGNRVESSRTFV